MMIKSSKAKAAKRRKESKILHMVRMHNVARDGHCRFAQDVAAMNEMYYAEHGVPAYTCDGPSELAHLEGDKRFKTRGRAPELRHTTAGSAMLCKKHHDAYDGRKIGRLRVEMLSNVGADGEMKWSFVR